MINKFNEKGGLKTEERSQKRGRRRSERKLKRERKRENYASLQLLQI